MWGSDPSMILRHNIPTYNDITINEILTFVCDTDSPHHSEIISRPPIMVHYEHAGILKNT